MTTKVTIKLISSFISIIVMTLLLTTDDSFARRRDREYSGPRHTHREKVIVRKHVRNEPKWSARKKFRYKRRGYYRQYRRDYYPARSRIIRKLPYGYRTVWIGDTSHFFFRGTFYDRVPSGYVVVKSPPQTVVIREPSKIISPLVSASGNVSVTVSTLNIRSGPGLNFSLVHQVEEGSILEVLGKTDGWLYVESINGHTGWVKSVFTEQLGPGSG